MVDWPTYFSFEENLEPFDLDTQNWHNFNPHKTKRNETMKKSEYFSFQHLMHRHTKRSFALHTQLAKAGEKSLETSNELVT